MSTRWKLLRYALVSLCLLRFAVGASANSAQRADAAVDLREPIVVRLDGGPQLKLRQGWSSIDQQPRSDECVVGAKGTELLSKWTDSLDFVVENRSSSTSSGRASQFGLGATYGGFTLGLSGSSSSSSFSASTALNEQARATTSFLHSVDRVEAIVPDPPLTERLKNGQMIILKDPTIYLASTYVPIQTDWVAFHKRCGDRYVSAIIRGAELNVYLDRTFSSFEQRKCWTKSRGGSLGFASVISLSGGSASTTCNATKSDNERINLHSTEHSSGNGWVLIENLDTLKQNIAAYHTRASGTSTALWAVLTPYSQVTGFHAAPKFNQAMERAELLRAAYGRFMYVAATASEAAKEQSTGIPLTNQYVSRSLLDSRPEPLSDIEFAARRYADAIDKELSRIRECVNGKSQACDPLRDQDLYDDYPLRVLLPLPRSKLTTEVLDYLNGAIPPNVVDQETYRAQQREAYAAAIEKVVVENSIRDRCEVLHECSMEASFKERARHYRALIRATLRPWPHEAKDSRPVDLASDARLSKVWDLEGAAQVEEIAASFVEPAVAGGARCTPLRQVYPRDAGTPPAKSAPPPACGHDKGTSAVPAGNAATRTATPTTPTGDARDEARNTKLSDMIDKLEV